MQFLSSVEIFDSGSKNLIACRASQTYFVGKLEIRDGIECECEHLKWIGQSIIERRFSVLSNADVNFNNGLDNLLSRLDI